jgi:hypothetical protein
MMRQHPRWFTYSDPAATYTEKWETLQKLWKSRAKKDWLQKVLGIYKFNFLGETAKSFVGGTWSRHFTNIEQSARLIVSTELDPAKVKTHLALRHPIHINGPSYVNIHHTLLFQDLGLAQADIEQLVDSSVNMRYGVLAKTPILQSLRSIEQKHAWVLHAWGVNLESRDSTDAQYVFGTGRFSVVRYMTLLRNLSNIMETAVRHVRQTTKRQVVLRVTKLGFGSWLTEMPPRYHKTMREKYDEMLLRMAQRYDWLQIRHPVYPQHEVLMSDSKSNYWEIVEQNHDPFGKPRDVTDPDYVELPKNAELVIVNAWDDRSFIGNGGSLDNSLDGWLVAGGSPGFPVSEFGDKMGSNMINASYLHNVFFCPNLLNESRWVTF